MYCLAYCFKMIGTAQRQGNTPSLTLPDVNCGMNVRSSRFLSLSVAVCVLMTCFAVASATAKKIDNEPTKGNPPVQQIIRPLAIHEIRFEIHAELAKNNVPSATELAAVINSRACDFSMTSRLLRGLT